MIKSEEYMKLSILTLHFDLLFPNDIRLAQLGLVTGEDINEQATTCMSNVDYVKYLR